ncbi:MAG: acetate/propionate family kinase [Acidobacteriaceae bacterium]
MPGDSILVVNTGSSSLKTGLYVSSHNQEHLLFDASAERLGQPDATLSLRDADGRMLRSENLSLQTHQQALQHVSKWLADHGIDPPKAVGHRVVHGGPRLIEHQRITDSVLDTLRQYIHFAPLHIPLALALIQQAETTYPAVPQFACFDTAFHRTLPLTASRFAIPHSLFDKGVRRYGFHGLSCESIVHALGAELPARTVIAHLGNGASLTAVKQGCSIDTSMGLTPTGGIPMGTRTGDLDPGVLLYLMRTMQMNPDDMETLLNHESGLKALSGTSADVRTLTASADAGDAQAQFALDVFCTAVAKTIAAYAVVLDGLDLLVFSGGIGEHSARVRTSICAHLRFLGVALQESANAASSPTISSPNSSAQVRIVQSREDLQIARHSRRLLRQENPRSTPALQ